MISASNSDGLSRGLVENDSQFFISSIPSLKNTREIFLWNGHLL